MRAPSDKWRILQGGVAPRSPIEDMTLTEPEDAVRRLHEKWVPEWRKETVQARASSRGLGGLARSHESSYPCVCF
jgi:hypothetical protein